jgi:S1-C subfamily serine protease
MVRIFDPQFLRPGRVMYHAWVGFLITVVVVVPLQGRQAECDLKTSGSQVRGAVLSIQSASTAQDDGRRQQALERAHRFLTDALDQGQYQNPAVWYFLGVYYAMEGDAAGADSSFDRVESMMPSCEKDVDQYRYLAWAGATNAGIDAMRENNYQKAKQLFNRANQVYTKKPTALFYLASLFASEDNADSALHYFKLAARRADGDTAETEIYQKALENVGRIYDVLGRGDSAQVYFRKARGEEVESPTAAQATPTQAQNPVSAEVVAWRRPAPNPSDIVQLALSDRNPSSSTDTFERAAAAIFRLSGPQGTATGFLITRDGLALTNHHVVENQPLLEATLRDARRLRVRVLRSDPNTDVALVQVDCSTDCPTLTLATANPRIGTEVHIIGNPMGLDYTLTRGVVSALRFVSGITVIQTDAALNPGNSGGPMLNARTREVLGIVSWKLTGTTVQGLGFAIATADALRVLGIEYR